ncbi:DUF3696 domain-containing protein [Vibrio chagasii]|uniref:AAA family ATPase n=1 Tax=Vibrio chagasii TaxID=170679 RepID=UPI0038CD786C
MIEKLIVKNIRSLENNEFYFSKLNIFSGLNSSGKSTLINLINIINQNEDDKIYLNGEFCNFGTVKSTLHYKRHEFGVDGKASYTLKNGVKGELAFLEESGDSVSIRNTIKNICESVNIRYLSSDRITPSWTYQIENSSKDNRDLGVKGELSISYMSQIKSSDEVSIPSLIHKSLLKENEKKFKANSLLGNIERWLGVISPGVKVNAEHLVDINASKLSFGFSEEDKFSPHSVGFGLTHCLPIILLVLTSVPGDILIIENPELNLHPEGQVELCQLFCLAAASGVQVILETHSDHIINSARLGIKRNILKNTDINLSYLYQDIIGSGFNKRVSTFNERIKILENGKLQEPPKGFFDTWRNSLMELV